jgi:phospholipid transport system substrate-binding protein
MKTPFGIAVIALFVLSAGLGCPMAALGGEATDQIRGTIDRGIEILMRPELQGDAKKQERRSLRRQELYPRFDFEEISRRALGVNWKGRTPDEKRDFIEVFKSLLEHSYASKVESYKGEKIVYGKESLDLPYAEVRTKIVTSKGEQFDINYRLLKNGDEWRIYDIIIEGVSLVNNYRSQFTDMLSKYSFGEMMERLRKTVKALEKGGG